MKTGRIIRLANTNVSVVIGANDGHPADADDTAMAESHLRQEVVLSRGGIASRPQRGDLIDVDHRQTAR